MDKLVYLIVRDNPDGYLFRNGEVRNSCYRSEFEYYDTEEEALEELNDICENFELNKECFYVIGVYLSDLYEDYDLNSNDISCGD